MKRIKKNAPKILTIVGTRPELIKLSAIIKKLDLYFNHILVHTGQNYDYHLNKIFFNDLKIRKPNFFLNVKSKSLEETIGKIIEKIGKLINKIKPDAVVIYGDTNSCLSAIPAKKNKVPIFHMEAGNRSFDDRVPEEVNRRIIDHISDINLVLSEQARQNLINEGIKGEYIFKTGSHMFEVINQNKSKIESSKILKILNLKKNHFFLVSLHREENVDSKDRLVKLLNIINSLKLKYKNFKIIISTHPRTKKNIKKFKIKVSKNVTFCKPFRFTDYCNLQKNAYCTLSDSGTIFEEASILNFPAITFRDSHERPEGIDSGCVVVSTYDDQNILNKIEMTVNETKLSKTEDYFNLDVSSKVIKTISGYITQINKKIYYK